MVTRCMFGLFIFGTNSSVIYRFLTDDLYDYLRECFKTRGYKYIGDLTDDQQTFNDNGNEIAFSIDDVISLHISSLIRVHEQSVSRHDPMRQITLESGVQVFFDQIAENTLLCMTDKTFETLAVLKAINLLKALIKFHIGALPFIYYNIADPLINRISASLQYFLNNTTINQSILFESCEFLHMNQDLRNQCREACALISNDVQSGLKSSRKIIIMTCNDKILHIYSTPDQSLPTTADIFLLVLNNTSRSLRKEFVSQTCSPNVVSHRYHRTTKRDIRHSSSSSKLETSDTERLSSSDDIQSSPDVSISKPTMSNKKSETFYRSEVVFLRTSNKLIAPFTLFTIPLTKCISVLILVEWENSTVCSNLFELIRRVDSYITHGYFPHSKLSPQIKAVESSTAVRRYFVLDEQPACILSDLLTKANDLHKSSTKKNLTDHEKHRNGLRILQYLTDISRLSTEAFRHLFFDSDEHVPRFSSDTEIVAESDVQMDSIGHSDTRLRRNEYDASTMTKILRKKLIARFEDWFSFIEVKSQRNITMSFCNEKLYPGLVHFAFIDRFRGQIFTPTLIVQNNPNQTSFNAQSDGSEYFLEQKILAFELECLSALQQGFTSYTVSDEHFTYNYTLRLQENNGAAVQLYKAFIQSQPPGVLNVDFYKSLANEYCPQLTYQTSVNCYELVTVHLSVVPPKMVREQCERLWLKLMVSGEQTQLQ